MSDTQRLPTNVGQLVTLIERASAADSRDGGHRLLNLRDQLIAQEGRQRAAQLWAAIRAEVLDTLIPLVTPEG